MSPSTSADSTRDRIVTAARAEFARYGIAGARITRIAKAARTSSERLYAYFRSKEELYAFVSEQEMAAVAKATRLDPTDLPEYAGRVHDYLIRHPDRFRLMSWGRLEMAGDPADLAMRETVRRKVEQLHRAQEAGQLDPSWGAHRHPRLRQPDRHGLAQPARSCRGGRRPGPRPLLAARRAAVVAAVRRLFPAAVDKGPAPG